MTVKTECLTALLIHILFVFPSQYLKPRSGTFSLCLSSSHDPSHRLIHSPQRSTFDPTAMATPRNVEPIDFEESSSFSEYYEDILSWPTSDMHPSMLHYGVSAPTITPDLEVDASINPALLLPHGQNSHYLPNDAAHMHRS